MTSRQPLIKSMRVLASKADSFLAALGIFLVVGIVIAIIATWFFSEIAETVIAGKTQAFDEAILRYLGAHRTHGLDETMLEITALGTGTVVMMIVAISGLFLVLTRHRYSALLLLVATAGGLALNLVLKLFFNRPRPHGALRVGMKKKSVVYYGAHAIIDIGHAEGWLDHVVKPQVALHPQSRVGIAEGLIARADASLDYFDFCLAAARNIAA